MCSAYGTSLAQTPHAVADPGFAQKGDRGEHVDREPKRGSGTEPPAWCRGRAPGGAEPLVSSVGFSPEA